MRGDGRRGLLLDWHRWMNAHDTVFRFDDFLFDFDPSIMVIFGDAVVVVVFGGDCDENIRDKKKRTKIRNILETLFFGYQFGFGFNIEQQRTFNNMITTNETFNGV